MENKRRVLPRVTFPWIKKPVEPKHGGKFRFAVSMRDFDPMHLWHLQVAQCAWDELDLDFVLFVPRGGALTDDRQGFDPELRYRMVAAATGKIPQFHASRIHIDNPQLSLLDTLKQLREVYRRNGTEAEVSLIVGIEDLEAVSRELFSAPENLEMFRLLIAPRLQEKTDPDAVVAALPAGAKFTIMDVPASNVTSKLIRAWYAAGRNGPADFLVPNAVRELIEKRRFGLVARALARLRHVFMPEPVKCIALSMGTFNPIHLWHLLVAVCALDQYADQVLFIPNGDPPHKQGVVSKFLRFLMVKAAIKGIPGFKVSRIEIDRPGKSYTVDTLKLLKQIYGPDVELCLIVGMDNLQQLAEKKWFHTDEILQLCRLLIAPRASQEASRERIAAILPPSAKFDVIDVADSTVSSTMIRDWYANGRARSADILVPNEVRKLINQHKPYQKVEPQSN